MNDFVIRGRSAPLCFFALTRIHRRGDGTKTALFHLPEEQCDGALALAQGSSVSTRAQLPRPARIRKPIRMPAADHGLARMWPSFSFFLLPVFIGTWPRARSTTTDNIYAHGCVRLTYSFTTASRTSFDSSVGAWTLAALIPHYHPKSHADHTPRV